MKLVGLSAISALLLISAPVHGQKGKPTLWLMPLEEPALIDEQSKRWNEIWVDVKKHLAKKTKTFTLVHSRDEATILIGLFDAQGREFTQYGGATTQLMPDGETAYTSQMQFDINCTTLAGVIMIKGVDGPDGKPLYSVINGEDCSWLSTSKGGTNFAKKVDQWVKDNKAIILAGQESENQ